jgi:starch-binding outer membrane protein, SusD/RagB family
MRPGTGKETNMSNRTQQAFDWRRTGRGALSAVLVLGLSTLTACNDLLDVDNEGEILDGDLNTVQAIAPVVAGVAGDFGAMYSQNASTVAVAAFELWHTGSFPSSRQTDEGFLKRPSADGNSAYNATARAYWVAEDAQRRIQEAFADSAGRRVEMAEVIVWGAYTLHFIADNFCEATFNGGPAVTAEAVRRKADEDFTRAITVATAANSTPWRQRALAGRARARLFLGDYTGAIADAQQIPQGFVFNFNYSGNSAREYNYYAGFTRDKYRREAGVHPSFFESPLYKADPRTPIKDWGPTAVGPDAIRRWTEQEKYKERDSDMAVSSWQEVRLIEAEAEIRRGNLQRAVTLINQVRAAATLPAYTGELTEAAVVAQLRYERSAELWLQGQALFDLRRFNDPRLNAPPGQGGGATRDKCFEIGQREYETNPNLSGK